MQSSINMNKSIFRNQHYRLANQAFDPNLKPVTSNFISRWAGSHIVRKWRDYVQNYAFERGVTITTTIAHKVAYKVANRPFATDPMPILQAELIKQISEALFS